MFVTPLVPPLYSEMVSFEFGRLEMNFLVIIVNDFLNGKDDSVHCKEINYCHL